MACVCTSLYGGAEWGDSCVGHTSTRMPRLILSRARSVQVVPKDIAIVMHSANNGVEYWRGLPRGAIQQPRGFTVQRGTSLKSRYMQSQHTFELAADAGVHVVWLWLNPVARARGRIRVLDYSRERAVE
jgi:hypothetical protein